MILSIGNGSIIPVAKLSFAAPYEGDAMRRLKSEKQKQGLFVDLTYGKATTALLGLTDGTIIATTVSTNAIKRRLKKGEN